MDTEPQRPERGVHVQAGRADQPVEARDRRKLRLERVLRQLLAADADTRRESVQRRVDRRRRLLPGSLVRAASSRSTASSTTRASAGACASTCPTSARVATRRASLPIISPSRLVASVPPSGVSVHAERSAGRATDR